MSKGQDLKQALIKIRDQAREIKLQQSTIEELEGKVAAYEGMLEGVAIRVTGLEYAQHQLQQVNTRLQAQVELYRRNHELVEARVAAAKAAEAEMQSWNKDSQEQKEE